MKLLPKMPVQGNVWQLWLLLPMDCSNDFRTAALVPWTLWEEFALSFYSAVCRANLHGLQGCLEFASKYLLENEIYFMNRNLTQNLYIAMYISYTFAVAIQNYLFGYISGCFFPQIFFEV